MEELLKYYANLLIVQYNGKPKAKATIEMLTKIIYGVVDTPLFLQIQNAFDWKTAVGNQLDIIGKWVGVSKVYQGLLYWGKTFLSYPSFNDLTPSDNTDNLQHGYSDYSTFDTDTGGTLTYHELGIVEQELDPEQFKTVIGLKIIKNSITLTAKNIDDAVWEYFGGQTYYSNKNIGIGTTIYYDEQLTKPLGDIYSLENGVTIIKNPQITADLTNWSNESSISTVYTASFNYIIYANNKFVAIDSANSYISTSIDGTNWSIASRIGSGGWNGITYGKNIFLVVGGSGKISASTDGITWSSPIQVGSNIWNSITYGNGIFVIVGDNGYVSSSSDGMTWSTPQKVVPTTSIANNGSLLSVAFGNNKFVATGIGGIVTSEDGLNWSEPTRIEGRTYRKIAFGSGKFVLAPNGGYSAISADGISWQSKQTTSGTSQDVIFANNIFVSLSENKEISTSSNGLDWEQIITLDTSFYAYGICYGAYKFIVSGNKKTISSDCIVNYSDIENFENYSISSAYEGTNYIFGLGQVYTTWDDLEITYHYPDSLETIMTVCKYKNVLPAPIGVSIDLRNEG